MKRYREEVLAVLEEMLGDEPGVGRRKMFGYPAFFAGAKMLACVYGDGVGLRVTEEAAQSLSGEALPPFRPGGKKKMNGWVMLAREDAEQLRGDAALVRAALERARDAG